MGLLEKKLAPTFAKIAGKETGGITQEMTNKALYAGLLAQVAVNTDLYQRLQNAIQIILGQGQLLSAIVGGDEVAASITQLVQELQANLAGDEVTVADMALLKNQQVNILAQLITKPTYSEVTELLTGKANASTVQGLSSSFNAVRDKINDSSTGLDAIRTIAAAAKTTADNALPKSGGTMDPGSVVVNLTPAAPDSLTKAVRSQDVFDDGAPFRFFDDVQSTPKGATMNGGRSAAISPMGGVTAPLALTGVVLTNTGGLNLATVITITAVNASGVEVFNHTISIALGSVPAVGKLTDVLSLSSSLPKDIPLASPVTFFISSSTGKFAGLLKFNRR